MGGNLVDVVVTGSRQGAGVFTWIKIHQTPGRVALLDQRP